MNVLTGFLQRRRDTYEPFRVVFPLFEVALRRTGGRDPAPLNETFPVLVRRFAPRWRRGKKKKNKKVGQRRWLVIHKIFALMGMSMSKAEGVQQEVYS